MNGEPLLSFVVRIYMYYIFYGAKEKRMFFINFFFRFSYIGRGDLDLWGKRNNS